MAKDRKNLLLRPLTARMPAMRRRKLFEIFAIIALTISCLQTAYQWPALIEAYGQTENLLMSGIELVISLILIFAVSRLRSRTAAIIFLFSYLFATVVIGYDAFNDYSKSPAYFIGLISIVFDSVAAWLVLQWLSGHQVIER